LFFASLVKALWGGEGVVILCSEIEGREFNMPCNGDGVEDVVIAMKRYHQKIFYLVRKKYAKRFAGKYEYYTFA
jgi:hypothetical protein